MSVNTKKKINLLSIAPAKLIVLSFLALILVGSLLLTLPISSRSGNWTPYVDALFTATSASCITGLVIYDTFKYWSLFGQLIILVLIQVGALGIVTLATYFSILLGKRVGLKGMILAQESINLFRFDEALKLIKKIVSATLIIELIGAILLSINFVPMYGSIGFYLGIFHSISAFSNSGFDIMSSVENGNFVSMTTMNDNPLVLYTISSLLVIGGLGFTVWRDIYEYRKNKRLLFHTKLVLVISATLLIIGALFTFANEFSNPKTLGILSLPEKINASIFHSAATRTAGFYSLPVSEMHEITKVFTIFLMFIGAAPGSTGGGIKVTTIGVLFFAIIAQVRGSQEVVLFKKKVHQNIINKALAITGLSAIIIGTIATIILAIEPDFKFIDVLYEATSAFGTAGLSLDLTPKLSTGSKILILIAMFLGRVGPLSFAVALTIKATHRSSDIVYPEAKIIVG